MNTDFLKDTFLYNTWLQYISLVIVVVLGLLLKNIISRIILFTLNKLFKNITEEQKDSLRKFLLKPIATFILLSTIYAAINALTFPLDVKLFHKQEVLDGNKLSKAFTIGSLVDMIFMFLIIFSFFNVLLKFIDYIASVFIKKAADKQDKRDEQLASFVKEFCKAITVIIGFFVVLGVVFEINVLTLITGLGIGGIAIALAAKESLENLIGSFTIFMDKPFVVGDLVKVDGVEGNVEKVGFRSTWIRTIDKTMAIIPNKNMIDGVLENHSSRSHRRVRFFVGLTYETENQNIQKIVDNIRTLLQNHPKIDPGYNVYMDNFNSSSIDVLVVYLCNQLEYNLFMEIKQEINLAINNIVAAANSGFAYPTQRSIEERVMPAVSPQSAK